MRSSELKDLRRRLDDPLSLLLGAGIPLVTNPAQTILPGILEEFLSVLVDAVFYLQRLLGEPLDEIAAGPAEGEDRLSNETMADISITVNQLNERMSTYLFPPVLALESGFASDEDEAEFNLGALFFPGMLFMAVLFVAQGFSDDVWEEKLQGTLRRVITTPAEVAAFLAGKLLAAAVGADMSWLESAWFIACKDVQYLLRQKATILWTFVVPVDTAAELANYTRRLTVPERLTAKALAGEEATVELVHESEDLGSDYDQVRVGRALYTLLADLVVTADAGETPSAESFARLRNAPRALALEVKPAGERQDPPVGFEQAIPGTLVMFTPPAHRAHDGRPPQAGELWCPGLERHSPCRDPGGRGYPDWLDRSAKFPLSIGLRVGGTRVHIDSTG
jgi:hypothetical protein